jgi:hypothetical protein
MKSTTRILWLGLVLGAGIAACSDDATPGAGPDASAGAGGSAAGSAGAGGSAAGSSGASGSTGTGGTDAGKAEGGPTDASSDRTDAAQTPVQRGDYIVNHVAACVDCHTPRLPNGQFDMTKFLAGALNFADIVPGDPNQGAIHTKNLTPHMTSGLGSWTDTQIKQAFLEGVSKDGTALFPIMPYFVFHNMTEADANAVVAYLRSIPAIDNTIPPRQPLGFPFTVPAQPVPTAFIPDTTLPATDANYASAQHGKYLAGHIGVCMECHTQPSAMGASIPIDVTKLFQGKRIFNAAEFGLPVPPFPAQIYTRNLTPHMNGIQGWTAAAIRTALKQGIDKDGIMLCPPMPAGPMQAFGGLTDQDALDIGNYVTSLAPKDNGVIPNCAVLPPPDGGMSDAPTTSDAPASDANTSDAVAE